MADWVLKEMLPDILMLYTHKKNARVSLFTQYVLKITWMIHIVIPYGQSTKIKYLAMAVEDGVWGGQEPQSGIMS